MSTIAGMPQRSATGMPPWVASTVSALRAARSPIDAQQALKAMGADAIHTRIFLAEEDGALRCVAGHVFGVPDRVLLETRVTVDPTSWLWSALQGRSRSGAVGQDPSITPLFEKLSTGLPTHAMVEPVRHGADIVGIFLGASPTGPLSAETASGARRALAAAGRLIKLAQTPPQPRLGAVARTTPAPAPRQEIFESGAVDMPQREDPSAASARAEAALRTLTDAPVEFEMSPTSDAPGLVDLAKSRPTPAPGITQTGSGRQIRVQITPTPSGPARNLTPPPRSAQIEPSEGLSRRVQLTPVPTPRPSQLPPVSTPRPTTQAPVRHTVIAGSTRRATGDLAPPDPGPAPTPELLEDALTRIDRIGGEIDLEAQSIVLRAGKTGLDALVKAFPGHLRLDRYAADSVREPAAKHSHVIAAMIRFGAKATEALEALSEHLSPEIRYYAVLTLGALGNTDGLGRVASSRLLDKDSSVRDVTVAALARHRGTPVFEDVVNQLRRALQGDRVAQQRSSADALALLQATDAWPELLVALASPHAPVSEAAHRALCQITWQDFGREAWKWQVWFDRHGNRPRVEWIFFGMMSDNRALRAGAFRELRRLARQNHGYIVDAPPADRRLAVERWRKWWTETGRSRFAVYR